MKGPVTILLDSEKKPFRQSGIQKNDAPWTKTAVLRELRGLADPKVRAKMACFGVHVPKAHGISAPRVCTNSRNRLARIIGLPNNFGRLVFMKRKSLRH